MFPAANIVTAVASYASAAAVGKVIADIVKNNTNPVTTMEKFQVGLGTAVLGVTVGSLANTYVAGTANELIEQVKKFRAAKTIEPV